MNPSKLRTLRRTAAPLLAGSILALLPVSSALAVTWGNTGTDFNAAASWVEGTSPQGVQPIFTGPAVTNPDLSANISTGIVMFSTTDASGYTISSANGSTLTLSSSAGGVRAFNTSGTNIFSAAVNLGSQGTIQRTISQAAGGTLNFTGGLTAAGSTTGNMHLSGGGTINLSGTNSFTSTDAFFVVGEATGTTTLGVTGGTTTVNIGTSGMVLGVANASSGFNGTVTASGGTLNLNGTNSVSGANIMLGSTGGGATTGTLNVSGGAVNISATSGLVLGIAGTNSTGVLNVNSGTITVNKGTIGSTTNTVETRYILLGKDTGKGTINLGNGAGSNGVLATDRIIAADGSDGTGGATTAAFVFNGGTLKALGANGDWLQAGTSSTDNTNAAALTSVTTTAVSTIDSNSFAVGINKAISGVGGFTINDSSGTGTGVVTLGGANTYTGATTVSAGTLKASVASVANVSGAFGNNSAVSMANVAGATLDITGFNTQIGSLTGGGTTGGNLTLGAATLTVGGDNTSPAAYAGIISGTGGALTKIGAGTLTLTGANTYTGVTTIGAGTLSVGTIGNGSVASGNLGSATNAAGNLVFDGGTLQYTGATASTDRNFTINAGKTATFDIANAATNLTIIGASTATNGALTKIGAGMLTLSGSNSYTGATTVSAGTLKAGAGNVFSTALQVMGNGTLDLNGFNATVSGAIAGSGGSYSFYFGANSVGQTSTVSTGSGSLILNGNLGVDSGAVGTNIIAGKLDLGGNLRPTINVAQDVTPVTLIISAVINHTDLTKTGAGTLILTGANTSAGRTSVSAGTLQIGNGGTTGSLFAISSPTGLVANGTLAFNRSDTITQGTDFGTVISGTTSGAVRQMGSGTLILNGANTYIGKTIISAGTLSVGTIGDGGVASGNLGSASNAAGNLVFDGGTLQYTGATASTDRNFTINAGKTATFDITTGNLTVSGASTASNGALTKTGAGTLTLSGANAHSGATTVNAGTLLVGGTIASSATTVNNAGSKLGGTGSVGNVTVGSGAILQGGDGTVASGALTSGGNISLTDGSIIKLTLGTGLAHSSLNRTSGIWSFDGNQAFDFTILNGATAGVYDNVISGLTGAETGLGSIGTWVVTTAEVTGTLSYDNAGGVDLTVNVIPEPGSVVLLLGALPSLGLRRWRRGWR